MLYHFAITPDAFDPSAVNAMNPPGTILVELLKGLCENGLLADLHAGQWLTEIHKKRADPKLPPSVRDQVETCLEVLHDRSRFVLHPAGASEFATDFCRWLHWSLARSGGHADGLVSGVFSSDDYVELSELESDVLTPLSMALNVPCWRERRRQVRIRKTVPELKKLLRRLVGHARSVTLIDPYMNCRDDRFFDTVQHCADLLGVHRSPRGGGRIDIHAGDPDKGEKPESVKVRLDAWKYKLGLVARQWKHRCRVFLWGQKGRRSKDPLGPLMHDRYVITDQCGVEIPGGLDFLPDSDGRRANHTNITLQDPEVTRSVLLEDFHHAKSPYDYLGMTSASP